MDEMLADLISEGTLEGLEAARARGRTGGRKPKLTARQAQAALSRDGPSSGAEDAAVTRSYTPALAYPVSHAAL
jgi:DNA invertase Pin-like site-specific DNA recombinase